MFYFRKYDKLSVRTLIKKDFERTWFRERPVWTERMRRSSFKVL